MGSGKGIVYTGNAKIRSKFLNTRLIGSVDLKTKNTVSSKFSFDYSVPAFKFIKPNRFEFSSKFTNRTTKTTMKYQVKA